MSIKSATGFWTLGVWINAILLYLLTFDVLLFAFETMNLLWVKKHELFNETPDFYFSEIIQPLIGFLIVGNFTECVQVQLTWKFPRLWGYFNTWRAAHFPFPVAVLPLLRKKEKRLFTAPMIIDIYIAFSGWKFRKWFVLYLNLFSLNVIYGNYFTWARPSNTLNEQRRTTAFTVSAWGNWAEF